jgi:hypothetical protein
VVTPYVPLSQSITLGFGTPWSWGLLVLDESSDGKAERVVLVNRQWSP